MKNGYEIFIADKNDSPAIKKLFEKTSYPHLIDLQFRRGDYPYRSFMAEDKGADIMLVKDTAADTIIGMGACSYHDVLIDNEIKRGAYINGLKILPEYQKRYITLLPSAIKSMFDLTMDKTDIYYATVLEQAVSTQKTFEKKRSFMPVFDRQCTYTSFLFKPFRKTYGLELEKGNVNGLDDFYEKNLCKYNFAPVTRHINGACDDNYITWRKNGKILAACVILNNQSYKNYYLNGYNGIFRLISHLPTKLMGYPAFPKPGCSVDNVSLSMLMFDESLTSKDKSMFIKAASSYAADHDVVMTGIADNDPSYEAFNYIKHIKYSSILYTVNPGEVITADNRPIYIDVAYM